MSVTCDNASQLNVSVEEALGTVVETNEQPGSRPESTSSLPADVESKLPHIGFMYLGCLTLLGYQMILTFTHVFDCEMFQGRTWLGSGWAFWCFLSYAAPNTIVAAIVNSRTLSAGFPFSIQVALGCVFEAVCLAGLLCLKVAMPENGGPDVQTKMFAAAMLFVACQGVATSLLCNTIFALAGSIDKKLTLDAMIGQGLAGIAGAAVGAIVGDSHLGLAVSFALCALMACAGLAMYFGSLKKNPHVSSRDLPRRGSSRISIASPGSGASLSDPAIVRRSSSLRILKRAAWPQCVTVAFVYVVTFCVFPGVVSGWEGADVVKLIATFQLLDVVGRFAPRIPFFYVHRGWVVSLFSLARAVFVPVFIAMERSDSGLAANTALQFILIVAFGFTNGYVSTLSMMLGPGQRGLDIDEAAPAGTLMSFFVTFGILIGSLLGLTTNVGMSDAPSVCGTAAHQVTAQLALAM